MTRLAGKVRGNMAVRLAERGSAVVAGGTTGGDSGVVQLRADRETRSARVAHLTRRDGKDVVWRLAGGDDTVVTIRAWRIRLSMINPANVSPTGGLMARPAIARRLHMGQILPRRHRIVVATEAISRRCLEAAGRVTGRAID